MIKTFSGGQWCLRCEKKNRFHLTHTCTSRLTMRLHLITRGGDKVVVVNVSKKVFNGAFLPSLFLYETRQYRYLSYLGGAGSGKSVFMTQRTVLRCLRETGHRILVVRKVASTLRNSVYRLFKDVIGEWGLSHLFTFSDSYMTIKCVNGSEIIFVGLDNAEKMKSIAGITSIWIEEATELSETEFNQLDLRLRGQGVLHKEVVLTFNPISERHWIKKHFYDDNREDTYRLTTTYKDNKFLDDYYKEVLEGLKDSDPVYYNIYCLAKWGSTGHLVWSNYKVENFPTDLSFFDKVYAGLDFGFNDPSALCCIGVKDTELYIFGEFYQSGLTNTQLIDKLTPYKHLRITADCAEPDRIREFQRAGFNISGCYKSKTSFKREIDWIRRQKLHVHFSCKEFIGEISTYTYIVDSDGNPTETPIGVHDHLMSALRYGTQPMSRQDSIQFLK